MRTTAVLNESMKFEAQYYECADLCMIYRPRVLREILFGPKLTIRHFQLPDLES
jgi:hypothetical protein